MRITAKKVMAYTMLPGIAPRMRDLFSSGFSHIAFFMAQIYRAARLLPPAHPYLNPSNTGRFGVRHVVAAAAGNVKLRWENADQIAIFFLIMTGLVILTMQFALLVVAVFMHAAHATPTAPMPTNFAEFFVTPDATNDLAFIMLDRVFGIPGIFIGQNGAATCVAANAPCFQFAGLNPDALAEGPFPWPFHLALRSMFQLYSIGLLVIALMIFLYFVVTVTVETAESGTPFGRRFNHLWAPLRLVAALGLLIPLPTGLNSAQYIVLYAAKWGSGFATNGWNLFLSEAITAQDTLAGNNQTLIATPDTPEITTLLEFMTVAHTCRWAETVRNGRKICGWLVRDGRQNPPRTLFMNATYQQALDFYGKNDVVVRFGEYRLEVPRPTTGNPTPNTGQCEAPGTNPNGGDVGGNIEIYSEDLGKVKPYCGEVVLQTTVIDPDPAAPQNGSYFMQEQYYEVLKHLWLGNVYDAGAIYCESLSAGWNDIAAIRDWWGVNFARRYALDKGSPPNPADPLLGDPDALLPTSVDILRTKNALQECLTTIIEEGVQLQTANTAFWDIGIMQDLGWGGAAIWYNKIAQANGAIIGASQNLPYVRHYPKVMEDVRNSLLRNNQNTVGRNAFRPYQADGKTLRTDLQADMPLARAMWHAYDVWTDQYTKPSGEAISDGIKAFFGLNGLYAMTRPENIDVHPLALLVGVGKSLIESAIRNLGGSLVAGVGGGIAMIFQFHTIGNIGMAASSFLSGIAMIGLGAGFVLFYVIPFLPFIYFFFAVGKWVKGLFEAMVGVPLWALAHIRIDGDGLPGQAAMGGYFMILEIFLRPILIVFGLLASILLFSAQVRILHEIWELVTSNLTGFDNQVAATATAGSTGSLEFKRDVIDQFFFTVVYAIMVYMLGTSSFKLIELIPSQIMRWMGTNVDAFVDYSDDPAENLVRNTSIGANMVTDSIGSISGGLRGATQNLSAKFQGRSA